eukprot:g30726.t1
MDLEDMSSPLALLLRNILQGYFQIRVRWVEVSMEPVVYSGSLVNLTGPGTLIALEAIYCALRYHPMALLNHSEVQSQLASLVQDATRLEAQLQDVRIQDGKIETITGMQVLQDWLQVELTALETRLRNRRVRPRRQTEVVKKQIPATAGVMCPVVPEKGRAPPVLEKASEKPTPFDDCRELVRRYFKRHLEKPDMMRCFESLGFNISEAYGLFKLLDTEQSGNIECEELLEGCLRLRGPANAIDVATLQYSSKRVFEWWRGKMDCVEETLMCILDILDAVPSSADADQKDHMRSVVDKLHIHRSTGRDTRIFETWKKFKQK